MENLSLIGSKSPGSYTLVFTLYQIIRKPKRRKMCSDKVAIR